MNSKVVGYQVLVAFSNNLNSVAALQNKAEKLGSEGWNPLGGPQMEHQNVAGSDCSGRDGYIIITQAMVKYE